MGNVGTHVLIFDTVARRQGALDEIATAEGFWVTLAATQDQATAVLRSALHPLIVMIGLPLKLDPDWDGAPLVELVCDPDFAKTHAFIIIFGGKPEEPNAEVRERIDQSGATFVKWLRLPTVRTTIGYALLQARRTLDGTAANDPY